MRIGLDLDGTLADHTWTKLLLAHKLGFALSPPETASEIIKEILPEEPYRLLQKQLYGELSHLAVLMPYAKEVLGDLSRRGHSLSVVSRRKADGRVHARAWLKRHFGELIAKDRVFFVDYDPDKEAICQRENIEIFVDDQTEVLGHLVSVSRKILFDPFDNFRGAIMQDVAVVRDWREFYTRILKQILP